MFRKWGQKDQGAGKSADAPATSPTANAAGDPSVPPDAATRLSASAHAPLDVAKLRRTVDPATLGFATTAELTAIDGLIGQERALRAIEFASNMATHDHNIFVLGPPASGKTTAVKAFLARKTSEPSPASDWVYVNNFENPNRPRSFRLPCGRARAVSRAMIGAIDELRTTVPAMFEGDEYTSRRRTIDESFRSGQEAAFEVLNQKALAQNIAILRTPNGIAMAPMHEGKVVKPDVFNALPEEMRKGVQQKIETLQREMEIVLEAVPKSDKERRGRLAELNEEMARLVVIDALDDLRAAAADLPELLAHLDTVHKDMVRNIALFLAQSEDGDAEAIVKQPVDVSRDPRFRRYMMNVMVANENPETCATPIVEELNPTYGNLIGRIEHVAQMGALLTDFLLLKPGALHRANGGYLLVDARKMLLSPFAWEALKRALKAREIRIEQPIEQMGFASTQTLDPEPIPLAVKVVLFGDRELYYLLAANDPDFARLFKVQADFDDTIARNAENDMAYARLVASIVREHGLKPLDVAAVARVIDEGARLAEDREKLSIEIGRIADIVREADYWAGVAGRTTIGAVDIARAVDEHIQRSDRLRDRSQEIIGRDIVMIDTTGAKVGQINGLSVLQLGDFAFGKPSRISARVRMGQGRVTDIEREVNLGGPLHSKGVMILWGYLAGRFAENVPMAMAATLVFEQSYGGVDGDSASSAELYALLSALSGVAIRQGLAVTGSVNQWGEVQAIGGVNEKIEGFFDVCKARGLDGSQGVLIPRANEQHLMLREDVVAAAAAGQFHIHSVARIDEGIEVLTGIKAGERAADGIFPAGSINRLVEDRLVRFAERARAFSRFPDGRSSEGGDVA